MVQELLSQIKVQMKKAVDHFSEEIKQVRTGRAQSTLVDNIHVLYYGANTPLKSMATVVVPDATSILIQPWDPKSLNDIEQAIRQSDLGLQPSNDGRSVRISVPPLTTERRSELTKLLHKMGEEARVVLRGIRKETWDNAQKLHKDGKITEDEKYYVEEQLNKIIDDFNTQIEKLVAEKETDILTV